MPRFLRKSVRVLIVTFALVTPLLTAGPASAWAVRWSTTYDGSQTTSDTFTVDLFLDAEPGLQLFSVGVLWDAAIVSFDTEASTSPDIILESANPGPGEADGVYRFRDPWIQWPGHRPAGFDQVNIEYVTPLVLGLGFPPAAASGTGISLGSLVFHVDNPGDPQLFVAFTSTGLIYANHVVIDTAGDVIPTPIGIVDVSEVSIIRIPEPGTSLLCLGGLLTAIRLGRRQGA